MRRCQPSQPPQPNNETLPPTHTSPPIPVVHPQPLHLGASTSNIPQQPFILGPYQPSHEETCSHCLHTQTLVHELRNEMSFMFHHLLELLEDVTKPNHP